MKKRLLIVLSLAGTCLPAFAQNPGITFRDLSKERNTSVSVTKSLQTRSTRESHSEILSPPDTTKMVSGSSRVGLITGQEPVKTKVTVTPLGTGDAISHWRTQEPNQE